MAMTEIHEPAPVRRWQTHHLLPGLFWLLVGAETAIGGLWATGWLHQAIFWMAHALVVILACVIWWHCEGASLKLIPFVTLAMLFAGPLGAISSIILAFLTKWTTLQRDLLDEWYERLAGSTQRDSETAKFRDIVSQRARAARPASIRRFEQVIENGSVIEKQTLLGIFALKYHPDFFPLLKLALRDNEPTIRVQAAAVYAKLRMRIKERFAEALKTASADRSDTGKLATGMESLQYCIRSGFLDGPEISRARKQLLIARNAVAVASHDQLIRAAKPPLQEKTIPADNTGLLQRTADLLLAFGDNRSRSVRLAAFTANASTSEGDDDKPGTLPEKALPN